MRLSRIAGLVPAFVVGQVCAQAFLADGGFEQTPPAWQSKGGYGSNVRMHKTADAHAGQHAARLSTFVDGRFAVIGQQTATMPSGVYELTVWCKGKGRLRLTVRGVGQRRFVIAEPGWHAYSTALDLPRPGKHTVTVDVAGDALVDDVTLVQGDARLQGAWKRQQAALEQFGYVPSGYSAQRPAPRSHTQPVPSREPAPMTDKVVFYDPRYDAAWNTSCDRIAAWFAARGFAVRGAPELAGWMRQRIATGAFGSVVVMGMGLAPRAIVTPVDQTCLIRRYMDAGGRVVWTGDTALYVVQGETGPTRVIGEAGMAKILGITCDWGAWRGTPQLTGAGKRWGLQAPGTCLRAARLEEVTLSLSDDPTERTSAVWLLTTNPAYPLSGFVTSVFALDGNNTKALADFYRMAMFTGKPVRVPPPTRAEPRKPPPTVLTLCAEASGVARRAFVRGEVVRVRATVTTDATTQGQGELKLALTPGAPRLRAYDLARMGVTPWGERLSAYQKRAGTLTPAWTKTVPVTLRAGTSQRTPPVALATAGLAVGDYELHAVLTVQAGPKPFETRDGVAVCARPRRDRVYWGLRGPMPKNPYRLYAYVDELRELGFDLQCGAGVWAQFADACLRNGQTFVVALEGPEAIIEPRKGARGEDFPNPWGGGRPGLKGLAGQACRDKAVRVFGKHTAQVARFPAFAKVLITNDDFSARGGWDYNPHNVKEFKAKTGLDAPVPEEFKTLKPPYGVSRFKRAPGIVSDNDPWLRWNAFLSRDVAGGFNDATRRGVVGACPDARVGPVPGGAQWPLFMISSAQYPPMNFGKTFGFNCVWYYCYEGYWQPSLAYLYWSELGRMGHRDLPVWTMPDAGGDARHYVRNVANLLLAAGNKGIVYFIYSWMEPEGRKELGELGERLRKYGPLLYRLQPAPKRVGLLVPFSQACFEPVHPLNMVYVFANLVQAHVDAEPVAEEELGASTHRVIALSGVRHLSAGAAGALTRFTKRGGVVLLDRDCKVPVPGARRLDVSLGQGTDRKGLNVRRHGLASRIDAVRNALTPVVAPQIDSPEHTTVVRPFVSSDGTRYVYAVHVDSNEEYVFWRKNLYEPRVFGREPPEPKERIEAFLREHGMRHHVKETDLTVRFDARLLPDGAQVVDVFSGTVLPVRPAGQNRRAVRVRARRFGGRLLALLPAPVGGIDVVVPQGFQRGATGRICVQVNDSRKNPARGVYPLHVCARDPGGRLDPEISGYYAADRGRLTVSFSPAMNARAGTWTLDVRELLSGRRAQRTLRVR